MLKSLWKLLNYSFITLVIGVVVTLSIFQLQKHQIEIAYTVLNTNVIAKGGIDKNIKILFKNDTMPNLDIVDFAFWNNGTEYIDKKNISETAPLSISSDSSVQILDYKIIKKSRSNLNFDMIKFNDSNNSKIVLKLIGDDGLEKFDGVKLQIIYSGTENAIWTIDGRIKGNLNSFEKNSSDNLKKYEKKSTFTLIVFILIFILTSIATVATIIQMMNGQYNPNIGTTFFVFGFLSLIVYVCLNIFWDDFFYSGNLDWLLK